MGLTLLGPISRTPLVGLTLIVQEAEWWSEVRTHMEDKIQFLYSFMGFLSNHRRSGNVYIGRAISMTHFAYVCAQKAWTGISVLDRPTGSENWRYVYSAIPNAPLDNILDRLLVYLYDAMNLLIFSGASYEKSYNLTHEMVIQNIKVSQTLISLSLVH